MSAQFFEANAPVRGFRLADEKLAGTRVVQVLIEGKEPGVIQDPRVLRAMASLGEFIERQPVPVGKVVSFVQVLQQMKRVIDGAGDGATAALPGTREEVAQYLLLYSLSSDEQDFRRMVDADYRDAVLTVYLKTDDYAAIEVLTRAIDHESDKLFASLPVEVNVGGGMTNAIALNETMVRGKVMNLIQISALVLCVSSLLFRSLVAGMLVLVPLATSALVNLGLMGWLGIPLSMGTAAISAMAVGVGADYAVYFLSRVREEAQRHSDLRTATAAALGTSGKAIAYVATAVAGGYLCLCLSLFKVHVLLGSLVALTMVTSSLATVAFLPAVLLRVAPRFATRQAMLPIVLNGVAATRRLNF
jgi:predicted RND superfamily exporter protein